MHKINFLILFFLVICWAQVSNAQSVVGTWKTIDDETGKPRSLVQIYEQGGKLYGKITKFFPEPNEEENPLCKECKGTKKNQPILGMIIIENLKKNGNEWKSGTILDPKNGSVYDCKIWLEDNELKVRGYLGFFYRTQTWVKP
ncbi:MAG: DUF2147 domain-containing protein [Cytophagales bacterium]|nr:MAG: DUF2147 domain-containing protein [Cytophagales bacterium]TAF61688.1 MAG: DUF2147 domain-containing protein [Cytophagales bacterium]